MRVLVCVDGSPASGLVVDAAARRPWPDGTELKVFTVVHPGTPFFVDPAHVGAFVYLDHLEKARQKAPEIAEGAAARLVRPGVQVTTEVREGSPKALIVELAAEWGADLIMTGTHGHGLAGRFLLGSVSHAVALHAPCSVEIVRERKPIDGD